MLYIFPPFTVTWPQPSYIFKYLCMWQKSRLINPAACLDHFNRNKPTDKNIEKICDDNVVNKTSLLTTTGLDSRLADLIFNIYLPLLDKYEKCSKAADDSC